MKFAIVSWNAGKKQGIRKVILDVRECGRGQVFRGDFDRSAFRFFRAC